MNEQVFEINNKNCVLFRQRETLLIIAIVVKPLSLGHLHVQIVAEALDDGPLGVRELILHWFLVLLQFALVHEA